MPIKIDSVEIVSVIFFALRIFLRHRENLPILKTIKKDFSKSATEATGTSIAITSSGDHQAKTGTGAPAPDSRSRGTLLLLCPSSGKDQSINERAGHTEKRTPSEQRAIFLTQTEIVTMRGPEPGARAPRHRLGSIRDRLDDRLCNHIRASHERAILWRELGALAGWFRETGGTSETSQTTWQVVRRGRDHALQDTALGPYNRKVVLRKMSHKPTYRLGVTNM